MNNRLKNVREGLNKSTRESKNRNSTNPRINTDEQCHISDEEAVLLLKTIVVNDTIESIKQKLKQTRKYRHKLLLNKELNLKETFPYFFTYPQLVSAFEVLKCNILIFIPFLFHRF